MNLAIDYGNTRIKVGLFDQSTLIQNHSFETESDFDKWILKQEINHTILSSVTHSNDAILKNLKNSGEQLVMRQSLPLPIQIKYRTPLTLGVDRIAAACGAYEILPEQHCLVIDIGTCINYEYVDDQSNYFGGAISPGVKMRFEAMHTFTAKLPLVNPVNDVPLTGDSTEACMQSGVINGVTGEIDGMIEKYKKIYPTMGVILTGGDAALFENKLKHPIFVAPNLVLSGLNRILLHNVNL